MTQEEFFNYNDAEAVKCLMFSQFAQDLEDNSTIKFNDTCISVALMNLIQAKAQMRIYLTTNLKPTRDFSPKCLKSYFNFKGSNERFLKALEYAHYTLTYNPAKSTTDEA